jgi:hypothetical protein
MVRKKHELLRYGCIWLDLRGTGIDRIAFSKCEEGLEPGRQKHWSLVSTHFVKRSPIHSPMVFPLSTDLSRYHDNSDHTPFRHRGVALSHWAFDEEVNPWLTREMIYKYPYQKA